MSERPLNADLAAVEAMLAGLVPAESSLGRDRAMYLAGRASVRLSPLVSVVETRQTSVGCSGSTESERCLPPSVLTEHPTATGRLRLWQATTAAATLLACALGVALGVALGTRPEPQVVIQRVEVPAETPRTADGLAGIEPQTRDDVEVDPEAAARRIERTVAYLRTWRALATGGLDALPSPPPEQPGSAAPAPHRPETLRDLIDELQHNM